jgi:hypothetical protein
MEKVRCFTDFVLSDSNFEINKIELEQAQSLFTGKYVQLQLKCVKEIRKILDLFCLVEPRIKRRDLITEVIDVLHLLESKYTYFVDKDVVMWPAHYYDFYVYLKTNQQNWNKLFDFAEIQDIISIFFDSKLFFKHSYQLEQLQKWIYSLNKTQFMYFK